MDQLSKGETDMDDNYTPCNGDTCEGVSYVPFECLECCYSGVRERCPRVEPCRSCGNGPGGARCES